ncbi:MAG TPA: hypothetical protein DD377_00900 [Firmicutes bacterium]|nr:hypothetical protein [Bacillota bacterium]HBM69963.1 hypothetical protein [Bacillota bacterium]
MKGLLSVQLFNFPYFLFIAIALSCFVISVSFSKKLGKVWTDKFITVLIWANFALHFLKQLNPFYIASWPIGLGRSTAENLCAFLVMVSPFVYKYGNKYMKDYLYYIGSISSILVMIFPTGAIGLDLSNAENLLEVFRFYICHIPLLIVGYLMVDNGFHELNYHRLVALPFLFLFVESILVLNGIILNAVLYHLPWDSFLSRGCGYINSSLPFGPTPGMDKILSPIYPYLIPYLMTYKVGEEIRFVPVLYLTIPLILGTAILGPLFALPFDKRRFKLDIEYLKAKRALKKEEKRLTSI